jgi:5-formyltetrahydrofolate cyclo-ligase
MTNKLNQEKRALRARMKSIISQASPEKRGDWSAEITKQVTGLAEWESCQTLLAFFPMTGEVDTSAIIDHSLNTGKSVGVPRMYGEEIKFHKIDTLDGPWDPHPYGLKEPEVSLPIIDPCSADSGNICVITPGLCFDTRGNRLGFGKGFYDRFIARCECVENREVFFAGVCFRIQLVDTVPTGELDHILDAVVTEGGITRDSGPRGPGKRIK